MADPALPCSCTPYENICCCGPQNGISVTQPQCQTLPDGRVVNNPAFVSSTDKSFWTYKFLTDCAGGGQTQAISNFGIPICETILENHVIVSEKIDGCGDFVSVPFELIQNDPNFGPAPTGFQWLKVETDERYEQGVCVAYRVEITGNYPTATEPIKVKAGNNPTYTFDCDCFLVPECNPQGTLSITKACRTEIINNQATLFYNLDVFNTGNAPLDNVLFEDIIFIPSQLTFGTITTDPPPPTLNVNTSLPGEIIISGNLGTINPGEQVLISYEIPILSISEPGSYNINNTANVSAIGTEDSASCLTTLNAVRLSADKCCTTEGSTGSFVLTLTSEGNSPDIIVDLFDHMEIPAGITIEFLSLSGCEGFFSGTTTPIPTNTPIPGPQGFDFICRNAFVPAGGVYEKIGSYVLVSSSVVGTATINNTITDVVPVDETAQVLLGVTGLPATASIDVTLSQICNDPCS